MPSISKVLKIFKVFLHNKTSAMKDNRNSSCSGLVIVLVINYAIRRVTDKDLFVK